MKIYKIAQDIRIQVGGRYWFEYHCFESPESEDSELWYHSHQQCTVVSIDQEYPDMNEKERYDAAMLNHYNIKFDDGFESSAGEDELYVDPQKFYRPDPPKNEEEFLSNPQKWK